jgi:hypothetical protein
VYISDFRSIGVGAKTRKPNIELPWSEFAASIRSAYANRDARLLYDEEILQMHKQLKESFDAALKKARYFMSFPDTTVRSDHDVALIGSSTEGVVKSEG